MAFYFYSPVVNVYVNNLNNNLNVKMAKGCPKIIF